MAISKGESQIIKAFCNCDNNETGLRCGNCAYRDEGFNGAWEDQDGNTCFKELHDDIVNLLGRNIPMKPLEASEYHKSMGYKHDCPRCHYSLGYKEKRTAGILPWKFRKTVLYEACSRYCCFCGQAIDWN